MLTTIILSNNNYQDILDNIDSFISLKTPIIIGEIGDFNNTFNIFQKHNFNIIKINFKNNYADCKNQLIDSVKTDWILSLEPNEYIIKGKDNLIKQIDKKSYSLQVFYDNNVIQKEIRLWHKDAKNKYINPIFETIYNKSDFLDVLIYNKIKKESFESKEKILNSWLNANLMSPTPNYYKCFINLAKEDYDGFIKSAEYYLFIEKQADLSSVMMRYYLGNIYFRIKKDLNLSFKNTLQCIIANPLMAEFWCLLGDIYLANNRHQKAIYLYENAKILGANRLKDDIWPIELDKYEKYPNKMIKEINKLIQDRL